jgi:chondroitin sulfate N-acetylgalactosaminyltransferase 1/2
MAWKKVCRWTDLHFALTFSVSAVSPPARASALRSEADNHHFMMQREEENQQEITRLRAEIKNLKIELFQLKNNPTLISDQLLSINPNASTSSTQQLPAAPYQQLDCTNYIRRQVGNAEILHGLPMNNEYELIPFNHFTFSRVYPIDLGLGKRVVEKPIGYKRKDLLDALNRALESLNKNATAPNQRYTLDNFIEGIYRNEPVTGTQYELYFRTKEINNKTNPSPSASHHNDHGTTKIIVMRPFAPLQTIQFERFPKTAEKEIIHIILPLSGRISTFAGFMEKFVKIALKNDRRVQLTVVYFGEDGLSDARQIMKRIIAQKSAYSSNLKLLALNETFSRGKSRLSSPTTQINCIFLVRHSERTSRRCRASVERGQESREK